MLRFVLSLILAIAAYQPGSAAVVRVANGDCAGLSNAVSASAVPAGQATVILARNGTYAGCTVVVPAGNIEIDGQGATFQLIGANIFQGATLTIRNASIVALPNAMKLTSVCFTSATDLGGIAGETDAICNGGILILDTVTIHGFTATQNCSGYSVCYINSLIASVGALIFRNVTFSDADGAALAEMIIFSSGTLEIYNSTISINNPSVYYFLDIFGSTGAPASATISNSLFSTAHSSCNTYMASVTSLGGNVANESSCGFSTSAGDKIVQDTELGSVGNHGGLVPTYSLQYGSPAHGIGVAQYCEALDARGYTRATNTCDAGAYEYGGGSGALTANGMNGVYYDPAANGHYVSIQRIHDNGDVLVIWNTFDHKGNPAWIYGVGQITDKHIHAAMSQNLGGVLQVGGPAVGSTVRAWGTVDIDLTSCLLAQFNYQSGLPEFGSGQFPLTRLAIVTDFGCSD